MEWHEGELTLVISAEKKLMLRPKMDDMYMEVLRARQNEA